MQTITSNLLREILRYEESYELLLAAARLADTPLDGVEYLERAMAIGKAPVEAYTLQIELIASFPQAGQSESRPVAELTARLKTMLMRDFTALAPQLRSQAEHNVAQFLIRSGECSDALRFIYPRLKDDQGRYLWWKFDLVLDYAEALMGHGTLPQSSDVLKNVRLGLEKARANRLPEEEIGHAAMRLAVLEGRLATIRSEREA